MNRAPHEAQALVTVRKLFHMTVIVAARPVQRGLRPGSQVMASNTAALRTEFARKELGLRMIRKATRWLTEPLLTSRANEIVRAPE